MNLLNYELLIYT